MKRWLNWWSCWIGPAKRGLGGFGKVFKLAPSNGASDFLSEAINHPLQACPVKRGERPSVFTGFTIIELMVVVAIMALVFGLGYAQYQNFNRRQILNQAALNLKNDLRDAQNRSLSGEKPTICGVNILGGYKVKIDTAVNNLYFISVACPETSEAPIKSVTLPQNVNFSSRPTPNPILFKVLAQGTNIPSGSQATITLTAFGKYQDVTVSPSGDISVGAIY